MLVRFDPEIRHWYSPVSNRSRVSFVPTSQSFSPRTDDVNVSVGASGAIVVIGEGESRGILVGELGLGVDASETPWGIGPKRVHEYTIF